MDNVSLLFLIHIMNHECVKYTLYKYNLKTFSLSPIFCEG